jgi:hypothetical protein
MVLLCLPLVVLGWLATRFPQRELALFSIALCTAALVSLGGNLISLYGFGRVNSRERKKKAVSN